MSVLSKRYFHDEDAAFAHVEDILWPNGPVCPKCGYEGDRFYAIEATGKTGKPRHGLKKCGKCRKQFTVRVGTVFESSHIPLHKWLQAIFLMASSKKGVSANQLHRTLEITLKSAWFLAHRIREAMRSGDFSPMGGAGGIVEIDETYIGKRDHLRGRKIDSRGGWHKVPMLTLVDRNGSARSFIVDRTNRDTILPIIRDNLDAEARVVTDDSSIYHSLDTEYEHAFVVHSKGQWGRGEIHTNTVEGFYSVFKRGMKGVYQHCQEKHLHRYAAEFDFRYNNRIRLGVDDKERSVRILEGVAGKRLTYRDSSQAAA